MCRLRGATDGGDEAPPEQANIDLSEAMQASHASAKDNIEARNSLVLVANAGGPHTHLGAGAAQATNALRMARKYESQLYVAKEDIQELERKLRGKLPPCPPPARSSPLSLSLGQAPPRPSSTRHSSLRRSQVSRRGGPWKKISSRKRARAQGSAGGLRSLRRSLPKSGRR